MGGPPAHELPLEQARQQYEMFGALNGPVPDGVTVTDDKADGPSGPVPLRVYTPVGAELEAGVLRPLVVYLHGGGFTIGSPQSHDVVCRQLADGAGAVVVSADYRLAPEHPYPAALDDAYAATVWAAAEAGRLGVDPARLAVAGDSAGGNLAAAIALRARDTGGPAIAFQLLVYPCLDPAGSYPSMAENAEGYLLTRDTMAWFWANYLGATADPADPYVSPLAAPDLAGLPPALVITAEFDPLRDEGEAYAARLASAGVPVTASCYGGLVHTFWGMAAMWPKAGDAMAEACAALRSAFGQR